MCGIFFFSSSSTVKYFVFLKGVFHLTTRVPQTEDETRTYGYVGCESESGGCTLFPYHSVPLRYFFETLEALPFFTLCKTLSCVFAGLLFNPETHTERTPLMMTPGTNA